MVEKEKYTQAYQELNKQKEEKKGSITGYFHYFNKTI